MRRGKRTRSSLRAKPGLAGHAAPPPSVTPGAVDRSSAALGGSCPGCQIRAETIEFLRMQNRDLMEQNRVMQDRFLSLAGDAAEKYHRIKMTEMASQHQGITDGVVPVADMDDDEDKYLDNFMSGFLNGDRQ